MPCEPVSMMVASYLPMAMPACGVNLSVTFFMAGSEPLSEDTSSHEGTPLSTQFSVMIPVLLMSAVKTDVLP